MCLPTGCLRCPAHVPALRTPDLTPDRDVRGVQDKARGDAAAWDAGADEELEDNEGNVYNRKTYEDLRRQGLI